MGQTRENLLSDRNKYFSKIVLDLLITFHYLTRMKDKQIQGENMLIDLRADAPNQTDVVDPQTLSEEVEKLRSLQNKIEQAESDLKKLKDDEKHFSCVVIPKIMSDMNLESLTLKDGSSLKIKKVYSTTMKADKKVECIKWLRDNGLGDIVKNNITVTFGQNEDNKAMAYANLAREKGFEPTQEEKVHPSTLKVTMEDWKNKGKKVPEDLFWVFDGNQTKIKNK